MSAAGREGGLWGRLSRRPALAMALALMLGIFAHSILPIWPVLWLIAATLSLGAARYWRRREGSSCVALLAATAFCGLAAVQIQQFHYPLDHISNFTTDLPHLAELELRLTNPPRDLTQQYGNTHAMPPRQAVTATVTRLQTWKGWIDCTGDILVQINQPHPRLEQGQTLRVMGYLQRPGPSMNPGQFDWASYYRDQRVLASLSVDRAENIAIIDAGSISPLQWLRQQARRALARGFAGNQSLDHALLQALVLGDNDPELRDVQESFRRTGTSHHLAISGMHVAVLGAFIFGICRLLRVRPRWACWISLIFVIVYGLVALPSPPVVRSVVLCTCVALGILQRRSMDLLQLLALSVLGMLMYDPMDLYNAGFQLSFGIVLGLAIFTGPLLRILPGRDRDVELAGAFQPPTVKARLIRWARFTIAASIVAWIISMPLIAYYFEQLNPWAIPASIILAPVVFVALVGGFAKIMLTLLFPSGASLWAYLAANPVFWMRKLVDWLAMLPGADVPFPAPPVWMILLYYALLLAMLIPWPQLMLRWSTGLASMAGCFTLAVVPLRDGLAMAHARAGELKITLLAIGAGQTCVVEPPGGDAVLFDAGSMGMGDVLHKALGPFLRHEGRRNVRQIFISHSNTDHFSAVSDVAAAYDVAEIDVAPQFRSQSIDNGPAEAMLRRLDQLDLPPHQVHAGQSIDIGAGASVDVLWPPLNCDYDANNCSLVLRLNFAGKSVLFTGDIQNKAELDLMQNPRPLHADVLVAPHHGSFESTTTAFVNTVAPGCIVCSNDRTLSFKQMEFDQAMAGRTVYRTHTSGAITIHISKDGQLSIEEYLHPQK